ncbi:MAG: nucleoside recognition protein [Firmicutes bacterium]|nr:nucleoside recognition protein [Bacillota bacterium]
MINFIWLGMIICSLLVAVFTGKIETVTETVFASAEQAVTIAFSLISVLTFWLGMMKLIEKSGLINWVMKLLRPLVAILFPRLPKNHPATQAILMNLSANLLGMGSAATPFGLKAMKELQTLNPDPQTASDEMCTFLAVNTSSMTLIPTTVIALRAACGSANPTEIVGTTIIATFVACSVGVISERLLRKVSGHRQGRK